MKVGSLIDGSRLVLSGRGVTNRYAPSFVRIYVIRHSLSAICIAKVLGDVIGAEPWLFALNKRVTNRSLFVVKHRAMRGAHNSDIGIPISAEIASLPAWSGRFHE